MSVEAKICGISTKDAAQAAVAGGARFIGFVFYPPSHRNVTPDEAAALCAEIPDTIAKVGVLVDPDDATLAAVLAEAPLDIIQLHGGESPDRVAAIADRFGGLRGSQIMKAIPIAGTGDLALAERYIGVADRILFDAKPPPGRDDALPGGNGLAFDWQLLGGRDWPIPWILSGGLDFDNVADAVRISGAGAVDASSGLEDENGRKDPLRIAAFLSRVAGL